MTVVRYLLVLGGLVCCSMAAAQAPVELLARGVRAYQDLELDAAAGLLRRALEPGIDGLQADDRTRALTYLAAAERVRGRNDSALAAFRRLIVLNPRHRPDPLLFPPEVTTLFERVRRELKLVSVTLPRDTQVAWLNGQLTMRLLASSPHQVRVRVASDDGRLLRTLYVGPIGDSIAARWDMRDSAGGTPVGRVWLTVDSDGRGGVAHVVRLPLDLDLSDTDTLAHPPSPLASELLPERTGRGTAARALAGGLLLGAAVVALPAVVSSDGSPSSGRFAVAGALSIAGIVGYLAQPPGRPIPGNAAINQARRAEWQRRAAAVTRENQERLQRARIRVLAGSAVVIERGATED